MPESTSPLCIILIGGGDSESHSFVFCINRALHEIAAPVWGLLSIEGIGGILRANSNLDDNLEDQTIVELVFESFDDLPAVFGRIGFTLAYSLGVDCEDTLLFRTVENENPEIAELSFMTLPDYALRFPSTLETSSDREPPEWVKLLELEQSLRSA